MKWMVEPSSLRKPNPVKTVAVDAVVAEDMAAAETVVAAVDTAAEADTTATIAGNPIQSGP